MVTGLAANHLHKKQADSEAVAPRPRMVRVGKELASLMVRLLCPETFWAECRYTDQQISGSPALRCHVHT